MSWINLGEVHCVLRRSQGEDAAIETVRDLRDVIEARLPDEYLVLDAAREKADYSHGLRRRLWTGSLHRTGCDAVDRRSLAPG